MKSALVPEPEDLPAASEWKTLSMFCQTYGVLKRVDELLAPLGLEVELKQANRLFEKQVASFRFIKRISE